MVKKNSETQYEKIYHIVRGIPRGRVMTYGEVARRAGNCTARMVGYAMAGLRPGNDVPWHRVINAKGEISDRASGDGALIQRKMLESEGIIFDTRGKLDLLRYLYRY